MDELWTKMSKNTGSTVWMHSTVVAHFMEKWHEKLYTLWNPPFHLPAVSTCMYCLKQSSLPSLQYWCQIFYSKLGIRN